MMQAGLGVCPAWLLTDNGCICTAAYRGGYSVMESELFHLGITYALAPLSPADLRQVELFHQTLKRFLKAEPGAIDR